ncbi:hypothetical protein AB2S31_09570 [Elizabethkingia anophelis]|uniref:hypothetical protein n=1 Tax=Elizabethkingia anophelis TaxID=1117645 RepID=UPI00346224BB
MCKQIISLFIISFCLNLIHGQKINILDLGAKGDGIFDDTQIIQEALDIVEKKGGGTVIIPTSKNDYKISETLFIGANTRIVFGKSFLKLANYTKMGSVLVNKKGATNIEIIDPRIDANNIFAGGTGENGISFGDGGTCYVVGGIIKNCKSGDTAYRLGGKGFQVEDKNVKLFKATGTKIINCSFALSTQFDITANKEKNTSINVIYNNIIAENCDSFLLVQQVNGIEDAYLKHNVEVSNFQVINNKNRDGVFIFSRARGVKISNGIIIGNSRLESITRGRHSEIIFKDINIMQNSENIIDLRPSFFGNASTKSEHNLYILNINKDFKYLLYSSANDEYAYRELFDSKFFIKTKFKYQNSMILPQAIYKTSQIDYKQIDVNNKVIVQINNNLFNLYNKK